MGESDGTTNDAAGTENINERSPHDDDGAVAEENDEIKETKRTPLHLESVNMSTSNSDVTDIQSHHPDCKQEPLVDVCPICYEEFSEDGDIIDLEEGRGFSRSKVTYSKEPSRKRRICVDGCNHQFCKSCLVEQCKVSISRKEIPIPCPREAEDAIASHRRLLKNEDEQKCSPQTAGHYLSMDLVEQILTGFWPSVTSRTDSDNNNTSHSPTNLKDSSETEAETSEADKIVSVNHLNNTFSTESLSASEEDDGASSVSSMSSSPEYWKKYLRLVRLKEDPTLISCTQCTELMSPPVKAKYDNIQREEHEQIPSSEPVSQDKDNPEIHLPYPHVQCPHCNHQFCAEHGDMHNGMTCAVFMASEQAQMMMQSEKVIAETSKMCSHECGARIALTSGCHHVICTNCNQDMCYKCGTHIHLKGKVIRSCSECRQGYVDHRYYSEYRCRLALLVPFYLVMTAVWLVFTGVIFVLTCGFGCCFCFGKGLSQQPKSEQHPETLQQPLDHNPASNPSCCKAVWIALKLLFYPMFELIRDCACFPVSDGDILNDFLVGPSQGATPA